MKKLIFIIIFIVIILGLGLYLWRFGLTKPDIGGFSAEEAIPQPPELPE